MKLPQRVFDILVAMDAKFPSLRVGSDDQVRELTFKAMQQAAFELGEKWGCKKRDENLPQGTDHLAYNYSGSSFYDWDWQNGTTKGINPIAGREQDFDVTTQVFIKVTPLNWLDIDGNGIEDDKPTPPQDIQAVLTRIDQLEKKLNNFLDAHLAANIIVNTKLDLVLNKVNEKPSSVVVNFPNYSGRISIPFVGERTITLTPSV